MCGIAGIVSKQAVGRRQILEKMIHTIEHRGPDGLGVKDYCNCSLGHTRLSIVDLAGGHQPMVTEDGAVAVTFNGELYGFQQLREQYSGRFQFRTQSDTELLLALYELHGEEMLPHVPGMFAFAIWNNASETLFCARDRFGEKPFFYAHTADGKFLFASEIKALVASGLISRELNSAAVGDYLDFGYVAGEKTIYRHIHRLRPGHFLVLQHGQLRIKPYWSFPAINNELQFHEASERFDGLLKQAVRRQLVADVEIGCFLSGGWDSNTIAMLASQENPSLRTFSFGYKGDASELPFAKESASFIQSRHHEFQEEELNLAKSLRRMASIYDEPFSDSSSIPTFAICEQARRYCKVVLTGDGGDELLGGYTWWYRPMLHYFEMQRKTPIARASTLLRAILERISMPLGVAAGQTHLQQWRTWRQAGKCGTLLEAFENSRRGLTNEMRVRLGLPHFQSMHPDWRLAGDINDALRWDVRQYMCDDILVKTDRASMSTGLELRSPFLDVDVAEFLLSLPASMKITSNDDKILLKSTFSSRLPDYLTHREKQGFGVSNNNWLLERSLQEDIRDLVLDEKSPLYDLIPYAESLPLRSNNRHHLSLLILAYWYRHHLDQSFESGV